MSPLQSVPAHVRTALYWAGYVLGVLSQATTIIWGAVAAASPDVSMPLWLVIVSAVVAFAQTQLNLLAGSNVTDARTMAVQAPAGATTTLTADVYLNDGDGQTSASPGTFTRTYDGDPNRP